MSTFLARVLALALASVALAAPSRADDATRAPAVGAAEAPGASTLPLKVDAERPFPPARADVAPAPAKPAMPMLTRSLVLFVRAEGADLDEARARRVLRDHREWLAHLEANDRTVLAGLLEDDPRLHSAIVMPWSDAAGSLRFAKSAPGVSQGLLVPEVHAWYAEFDRVAAVRREGAGRETYVLGFFVQGPEWSPGNSPELRALQAAHVAHLERMASEEKLVLAGPLGGGGARRGVLLFRDIGVEDARALAEQDPTVQAGRLRLRLHEWSLPQRAVPWAP